MPEEPTSEMSSPSSVVVARCATEEDAPALLESVLGRAGFWDLLAATHTASGGVPADFRVVVKPDPGPAGFPQGNALHATSLSRTWPAAHFRVGFAKNKTHEEFAYALCLYNLWTVLPDHAPHPARLDPADACTDLLRHTPVHFNI